REQRRRQRGRQQQQQQEQQQQEQQEQQERHQQHQQLLQILRLQLQDRLQQEQEERRQQQQQRRSPVPHQNTVTFPFEFGEITVTVRTNRPVTVNIESSVAVPDGPASSPSTTATPQPVVKVEPDHPDYSQFLIDNID
ncbi:unnamed protein product, partial [Adineta steineri]